MRRLATAVLAVLAVIIADESEPNLAHTDVKLDPDPSFPTLTLRLARGDAGLSASPYELAALPPSLSAQAPAIPTAAGATVDAIAPGDALVAADGYALSNSSLHEAISQFLTALAARPDEAEAAGREMITFPLIDAAEGDADGAYALRALMHVSFSVPARATLAASGARRAQVEAARRARLTAEREEQEAQRLAALAAEEAARLKQEAEAAAAREQAEKAAAEKQRRADEIRALKDEQARALGARGRADARARARR